MTTCQFCESPTDYKRIATHWTQSPTCPGPAITDRQRSIVTGLLLSGAHFVTPGVRRHPSLQFSTTRREFAEWVMDELGVLVPDHPPEHMDRRDDTDWDFGDDAEFWRVTTRSAQVWSDLRSTPVDDYDPTPLALRVWYARRGVFRQKTRTGYQLRLGTARSEKPPDYWAERLDEYGWSPAEHPHWEGLRISKASQTKRWFEAIGEPVPGYEQKWPWFATGEGSQVMRYLQFNGPSLVPDLPSRPTIRDRQKGAAMFKPERFSHLATPVAYIAGEHDVVDVVRTYIQSNEGILDRYSPATVHRQISTFGDEWRDAARAVLGDGMGLTLAYGSPAGETARSDEGLTHQQSLKLAARRDDQ